MLVFITTLRHPKNAVSYHRVEALLARTIQSVCNQTNKDFRLIVVCNQIPHLSQVPHQVDFVQVDFPPPSKQKGSNVDIDDFRKDKATKVFVGLLHARKYSPDYMMLLDADDLVSNKIAEYVNSHPGENGWFINKGYIYGDGGILIRWTKEFHMKCGTSHILNWKLLNIPSDFPENPTQEQIFKTISTDFLRKALAIHRATATYFEELGTPLKPFPFFAGIWILDTGENHSGKSLLNIGYPVSKELKAEFCFETPKWDFQLLKQYLVSLPISIGQLSKKIQEKFLSL